MPAPLTVKQIALYMSKRRAGSRQEVAAAAVGISAGLIQSLSMVLAVASA